MPHVIVSVVSNLSHKLEVKAEVIQLTVTYCDKAGEISLASGVYILQAASVRIIIVLYSEKSSAKNVDWRI